MKIRKYHIDVQCIDRNNEKWNNTIIVRAVSLSKALTEFWNRCIDKELETEELISVTITNLAELRKVTSDET